MTDLGRWKRAVVHLEARFMSDERARLHAEDWEALKRANEANDDDEMDRPFRNQPPLDDLAASGTALFLVHAGRRYLVTARHVLRSEDAARAEGIAVGIKIGEDWICRKILRIPSFDEVKINAPDAEEHYLMNLSPERYSYNIEEDVAIVSLDLDLFSQRVGTGQDLAGELVERGYEPVDSSLIRDRPSAEGSEVVAVGFPASMAIQWERPRDVAQAHWSSASVSLPVLSFGRVSMLHPDLRWFWADLSAYPGNSGCPLIEDDVCVGLVTSQAVLPGDGGRPSMRIPFARAVTGDVLVRLLQAQVDKESKLA